MQNKNNGIIYNGGWQQGDAVREELAGPKGDGEVIYPDGARFKGVFYLNYAHIQGPAYAAKGTFTFADGSSANNVWINSSEDLSVMDLIGLYRVHHPGGPDTLTPFSRGRREGVEIVLGERPAAVEWYGGEKVGDLPLAGWSLEEKDEDIRILTVELGGGERVRIFSGRSESNGYGGFVFATSLRSEVILPDGTRTEAYGCGMKSLRPFDGWFTVRTPDGKKHGERWESGSLVQTEDAVWDSEGASVRELPDPFGSGASMKALVWNGHIEYDGGKWVYDGQMQTDTGLPHGLGSLCGNSYDTKGCRYEGGFSSGLFHGKGRYENGSSGIIQDGDWEEGRFVEDRPLKGEAVLKLHLRHSEWSAYSDDRVSVTDLERKAEVGPLPVEGFRSLRIDRVREGEVWLVFGGSTKVLTPGSTVSFEASYEGREWSDGSVMDGDDYSLTISW